MTEFQKLREAIKGLGDVCDFDHAPFFLQCVIASLKLGGVSALKNYLGERTLEIRSNFIAEHPEQEWILNDAQQVLKHWLGIEQQWGPGSLLDYKALPHQALLILVDDETLLNTNRLQKAKGTDWIAQARSFRFDVL